MTAYMISLPSALPSPRPSAIVISAPSWATASAALAVITALLGAGQAQPLAQQVEQRRPVVDVQRAAGAVHGHGDRARGGCCTGHFPGIPLIASVYPLAGSAF